MKRMRLRSTIESLCSDFCSCSESSLLLGLVATTTTPTHTISTTLPKARPQRTRRRIAASWYLVISLLLLLLPKNVRCLLVSLEGPTRMAWRRSLPSSAIFRLHPTAQLSSLKDEKEEDTRTKEPWPSSPSDRKVSNKKNSNDRSNRQPQHFSSAAARTRSNHKRNQTIPNRSNKKKPPKPVTITKSPEQIEEQLTLALDALKAAVALQQTTRNKNNSNSQQQQNNDPNAIHLLLFPTVRECNAALKAFGDARDLLRGLRVFGKMRKAATLQKALQQKTASTQNAINSNNQMITWPVPEPTLVTYSTLMSRFVKANKPAVALRLWNLMSSSSSSNSVIDIDVRAANILMNAYAKLANVEAAQELLDAMKEQQQQSNDSNSQSNNKNNNPRKTERRFTRASSSSSSTAAASSKPYSNMKLPPPNSITYNTFLSACHKAGDLDAAVAAVDDMHHRHLPADARTYTSLIATVARRSSRAGGARDPSPAFQFLQDMLDRGLRPNGMTYSALIDACGRCGRSDLALQGLRTMLRQKQQEQKALLLTNTNSGDENNKYTLANEVGAWTACINACGKSGRVDTALKLFYTMPNFGVQPNTITCGSLTDSLLRHGRTAETLGVLRYMKRVNIPPSEVFYTSLMARAEKLVELERRRQLQVERGHSLHPRSDNARWDSPAAVVAANDRDEESSLMMEAENTRAIEVYTELIQSLITPSRDVDSESVATAGKASSNRKERQEKSQPPQDSKSLLLLKVFLVFQEMKNAEVEIDLPCYNTLLRACAQAGDYSRAQDVLRKIQDDNLAPNDTTWRLLLRSASSANNSSIDNSSDSASRVAMAEAVWRQGLSYQPPSYQRRLIDAPASAVQWKPSVDSFVALISVYMREAAAVVGDDGCSPEHYYRRVVQLYEDVVLGQNEEMGMDRIDLDLLLDTPKAMLVILQAIVALDKCLGDQNERDFDVERKTLRSTAASILKLRCFQDDDNMRMLLTVNGRIGWKAKEALQTTRSWARSKS